MGGQYFAPMPTHPQNYGNVYNAVPPEQFYYYQWAPGHMPIQQYPQQGYNASPPNTPPQSGMQYGYSIPHHVDLHHGAALLPPTPPHQHQIYTGVSPVVTSNGSDRKPSWSSSGMIESPTTPFTAVSGASGSPLIVGNYVKPVNTDGIKTYGLPHITSGRVESLIRGGPPLPEPISTAFSGEATKSMGENLENPTRTTNVYIRGLPPDTDDDKLLEMVGRFGDIISHKAIMDTEHGTCKGYGFARYEHIGDAENCIRGLVSLKYEAGFARESFNARLKTLADPNSTNIYVSNLPRSMNEKDMQDIFEGYIVVSNRILRDTAGNSRGVGFARFENRNICDEIIKVFHGKLVGEEQLPLQVRYADTSAQKRLKATTTKKRQYRSNEYNNSVVNAACYMPSNDSVHHPPVQYRNRVWHRHNSMISNYSSDAGVTLERDSHEYDENDEHYANENFKLETVHENGDDASSSSDGSDLTTVPSPLELVAKCSSGSFSDPGESYGGLESV